MSSMGKPRSNLRAMFYAGYEDVHNNQQPYFLESCFLCQKPIGPNNDIFMYRGNTPFCSDECRQEQIEMDEAQERPWRRRTLRKNDTTSNKSRSTKAVQRESTVVVA